MKRSVKAWATLVRSTKEFLGVEARIEGLVKYQQVPCVVTFNDGIRAKKRRARKPSP